MSAPSPIPRSRYFPDEFRQRPRDYDPLIADEVIDRAANGEVLPQICDARHMPLPGTFLLWCHQDPDLAARYEQARRFGADVMFDEIAVASMIADPSSARVRTDALKFLVERSMPEKYGPRATLRTAKPDEDAAGGIDYGSEVRRKLEQMAARRADQSKES